MTRQWNFSRLWNAAVTYQRGIADSVMRWTERVVCDIMSELQSHRSIITGMNTLNGYQVIKARTPQAEIDKLFAALRNVTQGKAKLKSQFAEYAPVPSELQKKLSEGYKEDLSI